MRKLSRPQVNGEFDGRVSSSRDAVKSAISSKTPPNFASHWSDFKADFSEAQAGKCGFCEGRVLGLQYGDVEHFRPKAEVSELHDDDPVNWGRKSFWKSSVSGRKLKPTREKPGYWWLAYEWENYLLSCQICNQVWKGNLFPVEGGTRKLDAEDISGERALLISPFELFDPSEHFEFGRLGEILGLTERGRATIATCGLDRPSLRLSRYPIARMVHDCIDEMSRDITERDLLGLLQSISRFGMDISPHCGMVRAILYARVGLTWDKLYEAIAELNSRPSLGRHLCRC